MSVAASASTAEMAAPLIPPMEAPMTSEPMTPVESAKPSESTQAIAVDAVDDSIASVVTQTAVPTTPTTDETSVGATLQEPTDVIHINGFIPT